MEKRKIGVLKVYLPPDDKPFNFHNIENNGAAKEWLLKHSQDMSPERLFEEIYQIQQDYADEMMKRRDALKAARPSDEPSFHDTPEKEWEYYDQIAKEATMKAMIWLKKQNELEQDCRDSLRGGFSR